MDLPEEGIQQVRGAVDIFKQFDNTVELQAKCLINLASLLRRDKQLDAAEEATSHTIRLIPVKGNRSLVYQSHYILSGIDHSKGKSEKAIHHFAVALGIAFSFN